MMGTIASPLQTIRTASEQRLCLDLGYNGTRRLVEPYGLRTTADGDVLLYARRRDAHELRTYRLDRIEDVRLTDIRFSPQFNAEMTAGGPLLGFFPRASFGSQPTKKPGRGRV